MTNYIRQPCDVYKPGLSWGVGWTLWRMMWNSVLFTVQSVLADITTLNVVSLIQYVLFLKHWLLSAKTSRSGTDTHQCDRTRELCCQSETYTVPLTGNTNVMGWKSCFSLAGSADDVRYGHFADLLETLMASDGPELDLLLTGWVCWWRQMYPNWTCCWLAGMLMTSDMDPNWTCRWLAGNADYVRWTRTELVADWLEMLMTSDVPKLDLSLTGWECWLRQMDPNWTCCWLAGYANDVRYGPELGLVLTGRKLLMVMSDRPKRACYWLGMPLTLGGP